MYSIKNKKTCYLTSALCHLILFVAVGLSVNFSAKTIVLGNAQNQWVKSFLYQENVLERNESQQKLIKTNNQLSSRNLAVLNVRDPSRMLYETKNGSRTLSVPKSADSLNRTKFRDDSKSSAAKSSGQQTEALLALLHDAIQKQQHYPTSAMEMEREGRVTVKFMLFADGTIREARVVKSSGTNSLDEAALIAVHQAAPFNEANRYLNAPREFSIDVVFELAG